MIWDSQVIPCDMLSSSKPLLDLLRQRATLASRKKNDSADVVGFATTSDVAAPSVASTPPSCHIQRVCFPMDTNASDDDTVRAAPVAVLDHDDELEIVSFTMGGSYSSIEEIDIQLPHIRGDFTDLASGKGKGQLDELDEDVETDSNDDLQVTVAVWKQVWP